MIDSVVIASVAFAALSVVFSAAQVNDLSKIMYLQINRPFTILMTSEQQGKYLYSQGKLYYELNPKKKKEILYGRGNDASIRTISSQTTTSAIHFKIYWRAGHWRIEDMQSTNGTFLNGRLLSGGVSEIIRRGDTILAGSTEMQITSKPVSVYQAKTQMVIQRMIERIDGTKKLSKH